MKTTARWIGDYCEHGLTADELVERLTLSGFEVESARPEGDDVVIEAEVTADRADLQSVIGIARHVSALTGRPLERPEISIEETGEPAEKQATVSVEDTALCPRYTARMITGVQIGPSPPWLVDRLEKIGLRPVNNVVDITNYVLFESGQPLHAFDFEKLAGGTIVVRRAKDKEQIVTIDGEAHRLTPEMLVIADAERPVAVAGVMGGLDSEISESTSTLLLESAQFESTQVHRTSRALGLSSDSSYRFERGVDPLCVDWASQRAADLIQELCGGRVAPGVIDVWPEPFEPAQVRLRISRMNKLLGITIERKRAAEILEALEFDVKREENADVLTATVPPFRADVSREVDLIEEVARIHGYDKIPESARQSVQVAVRSPRERISDDIRTLLVGLGHYETVTNCFYTQRKAELISPWTDAPAPLFNNVVRRDENRLRPSIIPGVIEAKALNVAHGNMRTRLFEIGHVFLPVEGAQLPEERSCLAVLEEDGLLALKGTFERIAQAVRAGHPRTERIEHPLFKDGHAAKLTLGGKTLAVLGRLDPQRADALGCKDAPAVGEMDLELLIASARLDRRFTPLPVYPASQRDIAVVVDADLPWADIAAAAHKAGGEILESVELFDIYRGKQIPEGKKSVALSLTYRAADRTLTGDEVDAANAAVINALADAFGATLRS